jgi:hypothetical protein
MCVDGYKLGKVKELVKFLKFETPTVTDRALKIMRLDGLQQIFDSAL